MMLSLLLAGCHDRQRNNRPDPNPTSAPVIPDAAATPERLALKRKVEAVVLFRRERHSGGILRPYAPVVEQFETTDAGLAQLEAEGGVPDLSAQFEQERLFATYPTPSR